MKLHTLGIAFFTFTALAQNQPNIPSKPQPQAPAKADDDKDGKVVAETMGTMVQALATFSQDPHNPVIAGTCALQALAAFIKMIIHFFDDFATIRGMQSQEEIERWFMHLPLEKQSTLIQLLQAYFIIQNNEAHTRLKDGLSHEILSSLQRSVE